MEVCINDKVRNLLLLLTLSHREKLTIKKASYPILVYLTSKDDGQFGCFAMNGAIGVVPEDFQGSIQT